MQRSQGKPTWPRYTSCTLQSYRDGKGMSCKHKKMPCALPLQLAMYCGVAPETVNVGFCLELLATLSSHGMLTFHEIPCASRTRRTAWICPAEALPD